MSSSARRQVLREVFVPSQCREMIRAGALVAVSHSGGKDSQAMTILLSRFVPLSQLLFVHAPLGEAEWPGTIEHIERTIPARVPLILAPVASGKSLLEGIEERAGSRMRRAHTARRAGSAAPSSANCAATSKRTRASAGASSAPWGCGRPRARRARSAIPGSATSATAGRAGDGSTGCRSTACLRPRFSASSPRPARRVGEKPEARTPRSVRFSDTEWAGIAKEAKKRGMTAAEMVRHAAVGLSTDNPSPASGTFPPEISAQIERVYRGVHLLSTLKRDELVREGRQEELDRIAKAASKSQASIRTDASELLKPRS